MGVNGATQRIETTPSVVLRDAKITLYVLGYFKLTTVPCWVFAWRRSRYTGLHSVGFWKPRLALLKLKSWQRLFKATFNPTPWEIGLSINVRFMLENIYVGLFPKVILQSQRLRRGDQHGPTAGRLGFVGVWADWSSISTGSKGHPFIGKLLNKVVGGSLGTSKPGTVVVI